jgi:hypothetical protein
VISALAGLVGLAAAWKLSGGIDFYDAVDEFDWIYKDLISSGREYAAAPSECSRMFALVSDMARHAEPGDDELIRKRLDVFRRSCAAAAVILKEEVEEEEVEILLPPEHSYKRQPVVAVVRSTLNPSILPRMVEVEIDLTPVEEAVYTAGFRRVRSPWKGPPARRFTKQHWIHQRADSGEQSRRAKSRKKKN